MDSPLLTQHAEKMALVERAAGRPVDTFVPSPRGLGYRARIDLSVGPTGRLGYNRPRSHDHNAIDACAIARPEVNEALAKLNAAIPDARGLDRLELRSNGVDVVLHARLADRGVRPEAARALLLAAPMPVALNGKNLKGDAKLRLTVAGVEHQLSPETFYQVNLEVNEALVDALRALILPLKPAGVLDLYGGAGNLSMPIAAAGVPVTLIEREGAAIRDAQATVKRLGLPLKPVSGDAGRFKAGDQFFEVAVIDPPRAGAPGLLDQLIVTRPKAIAVVSCNPSALGRDIGPALKAGYVVDRLIAFDMFPHTDHVEALCWLTRR